jgi:hypothetical protein
MKFGKVIGKGERREIRRSRKGETKEIKKEV